MGSDRLSTLLTELRTVVDPVDTEWYLRNAFGSRYNDAKSALTQLANAFELNLLENVAYRLYEVFRPEIAAGQAGWGKRGNFNVALVLNLAETRGKDVLPGLPPALNSSIK